MTDRKVTCVACKSAITEGDIAHSDLEFGGELKATNQPEYTADVDSDLVATIGTLDEYTDMVRKSNVNQDIDGFKTLLKRLVIKVEDFPLIDCLLKDFTQGTVPSDFKFGGSRVWANSSSGMNTFMGHCVIGVTNTGYIFAEIKLEGNHGNKEGTLSIREKEDGTYSLSFFNGATTTTLVP